MGTPPPPGSWLRTLRTRYLLLATGLVAAALLVTAGCKRGAAPHPQERGGETATSAPSSSAKTAPAAAEEKDPAAAEEAGLEVLLLAPPGSQGQPLPWVAAFHGLGDTPENFAQFFGGLPIAARIYVFRAPLERRGGGYDWFGVSLTLEGSQVGNRVRRVAEDVAAELRSLSEMSWNVGKPIVTGFSQGGALSYALAALHPELVSGALPIAGMLPDGLTDGIRSVPGASLPPVRGFHGDADTVVPLALDQGTTRRLVEKGYDAELTAFPRLGHSTNRELRDAWATTLGGWLNPRRAAAEP